MSAHWEKASAQSNLWERQVNYFHKNSSNWHKTRHAKGALGINILLCCGKYGLWLSMNLSTASACQAECSSRLISSLVPWLFSSEICLLKKALRHSACWLRGVNWMFLSLKAYLPRISASPSCFSSTHLWTPCQEQVILGHECCHQLMFH